MHQKLRWIERANWITTRLPGLFDYFLLSHFIIALAISGHDSALHVRPCNESIKHARELPHSDLPERFAPRKLQAALASAELPHLHVFAGPVGGMYFRVLILFTREGIIGSDARTKKPDGIGAMGTCNQLNQIDTYGRPGFQRLAPRSTTSDNFGFPCHRFLYSLGEYK